MVLFRNNFVVVQYPKPIDKRSTIALECLMLVDFSLWYLKMNCQYRSEGSASPKAPTQRKLRCSHFLLCQFKFCIYKYKTIGFSIWTFNIRITLWEKVGFQSRWLCLPPLTAISKLQINRRTTIIENQLKSRWTEVLWLRTYSRRHMKTGRWDRGT